MIRIDDRGPAWWLVVPGAVLVTVLAGILDFQVNHALGVLFYIGYVLSCLAAVWFVRPDGLFVPMVVPPPLMAVAVSLAVTIGGTSQGKGMSAAALGIGVPLLNSFPVMGITTLLVLAVGGLRLLLRRRAPRPVRAGYPR